MESYQRRKNKKTYLFRKRFQEPCDRQMTYVTGDSRSDAEQMMLDRKVLIYVLNEHSTNQDVYNAYDTLLNNTEDSVGLDTEGVDENGLPFMVQIASEAIVILQHMSCTNAYDFFGRLMMNTNISKIMFSSEDDVTKLGMMGFTVRNFFDLQALTALEDDRRPHSLETAVRRVMNEDRTNTLCNFTKANFGKRGFSEFKSQDLVKMTSFMQYAAADAWITRWAFVNYTNVLHPLESREYDRKITKNAPYSHIREFIYERVVRLRTMQLRKRYLDTLEKRFGNC